jgi:hypothetical protein
MVNSGEGMLMIICIPANYRVGDISGKRELGNHVSIECDILNGNRFWLSRPCPGAWDQYLPSLVEMPEMPPIGLANKPQLSSLSISHVGQQIELKIQEYCIRDHRLCNV